jgi:hypothetical protein
VTVSFIGGGKRSTRTKPYIKIKPIIIYDDNKDIHVFNNNLNNITLPVLKTVMNSGTT